MRKSNKLAFILLIAAVLSAPLAYAGGPGFDDDVNNWDDSNEIPLDGGLSVLVAAGAAYGAKHLKDRKAKKNEEK